MKHTMKNPMKKCRRNAALALCMLMLPLAPGIALAKEDPIYTRAFSNAAAGGYDVTAYFTESRARKGKAKFTTEYMGAKWSFASRENLERFAADPEKYAPQYGGYCAWAVSQGSTASGDPLQWTVHNDKLYLNYNKKINERWARDKDALIVTGDMKWPEVLD